MVFLPDGSTTLLFFFRRVKYLGELKLLLSAVIRHDRQAAALHCRIDANIA